MASQESTWWVTYSQNETMAWSVEWFDGYYERGHSVMYFVDDYGDHSPIDETEIKSIPGNWEPMHTHNLESCQSTA